MVNVLRRWSQPIMVVVTILVVITFIWWQPSFYSKSGERSPIGTIYGQEWSVEHFQTKARQLNVHRELFDEIAQMLGAGYPGRNSQPPAQSVAYFIIFEHEADRLGISATPAEIEDELLRRTQTLQNEKGTLDPEKLDSFVKNVLSPSGFTAAQLDSFIADAIRFRKLRELIGSAAAPAPDEVRQAAEQQTLKTEASYVAWKFQDFRKDMKATDEELKAAFEAKKAGFKTDEKRRVHFAAFKLPAPPEGKPYETSKRTELMQGLAEKAYAFRTELNNAGAKFDELAKAAGAVTGETKEAFEQSNAPADVENLEEAESIATAAFKLTKELPYSEVITDGVEKAVYVLQLLDVTAPAPMTYEQAKTKLEAEVLNEKTVNALIAASSAGAERVAAAMKTGKTFYEAAESTGFKPVPLPAFTGTRPPQGAQYAAQIIAESANLAPGEISRVLPAGQDMILAHLDQRTLDEKELAAASANAESQLSAMQGRRAFGQWFGEQIKTSGVAELKLDRR